jgi:hypothetical protein
MKMLPRYKLFLLLLAPFIVISALHAQWFENGIAICISGGDQRAPEVVSDSRLGAIVIWDDGGIIGQRINEFGDILWGEDGVTVASGNTKQHTLVPDGLGGAIVAWSHFKMAKNTVYMQHLSPGGALLWGSKGMIICGEPGDQEYPRITRCAPGLFITAWEDGRGADTDIYVQMLDGGGNILWRIEGIPICPGTGNEKLVGIVPDGAGGAIIAWQYSGGSDVDIYAQRIDREGSLQWPGGGLALCSEPGDQVQAVIASDGSGGAIVAWQDTRGSDIDLYAQRVDPDGNTIWTDGGAIICSASRDQIRPGIVPDNEGGAIIAWCDYRGADADIFIQRMNAVGDPSWQPNGAALCSLPGNQLLPKISPDHNGGAIVTWQDQRETDWNIYAQRMTKGGGIRWDDEGLLICNAPYEQLAPAIASDGTGGAFMPWEDTRDGEIDIYAQRIDAEGRIVKDILTRYSAHLEGRNIVVKWTMSSERRNPHFFVFRAPSIYGPFRAQLVEIKSKGTSFSFVDETCREGQGYTYRVELLSGNYRKLLFETPVVMVPSKERVKSSNSPNPFNPSTTISYTLPGEARVRLEVYDVAGRRIANLVDAVQGPGDHSVLWDGKDSNGVPVTSGIYFYRITAGDLKISRKMILVR